MKKKDLVRRFCPKIPLLRKQLTRMKLKEYYKHVMPEAEIVSGEQDAQEKRRLVEKYAAQWPAYTAAVDAKIEEIFRLAPVYAQRQDRENLRMDMRFCRYAYGFQPDEYEVYKLEEKNMAQRRAYVSDIERYRYVYRINDIIDVGLFFDKYATYKAFVPYYHREAIFLEKSAHFEAFQQFVRRHPVFVKKRVELSKGDSVALVNTAVPGFNLRDCFNRMIAEGRHILEEKIVQSDTMAKLNPSSVNTVRCITFNTRKGIRVAYCFLKVGCAGSFVDNGGAGGILIGINKDNGKLDTEGFDEFGTRYVQHPSTNTVFNGYQLPEWKTMIELCKELSAKTPTVRYIGWDMAHTDEGWVIVEGNGSGQFIGPQIVWERGIKAEMERYLAELDCIV